MHERDLKSHAVLLQFEYDGRTFMEVDRRSEAMKVVASDPTRGYEGHSGFWYEVQNAAGDTLYRRITHDPTFPYREVSSPEGTMTRVSAPDGKRTIEVIVPDIAEGEHVVLFAPEHPAANTIGSFAQERSRQREPRVGTRASREVARFALRTNGRRLENVP